MIVLHGNTPVGVLRLDRQAGGTEVSILVDPQFQGRGIAAAALRIAHFVYDGESFVATVHPQNQASAALFRGCGYRPDGDRLRYGRQTESLRAPAGMLQ
jgi:RimJ/RimL family protein N-acetyltransferase